MDLTNAYYWMRICKGDEWKTAFRTRYGHFEYQVMPFGLSNAPATFQGYVNKILAEKLDVFVIVYLDDILIYTEDPGQPHVDAVRWVLDQLRKYSLFANLKKYCFHQDEIHFLGYVVSSKGISMEAKKIEVIKKWLEPKSVRDIQVFLGFANFYQRFIQGFSKIAAPLTSILKTTVSLQVLVANEVLAADKVDGVEGGDKSIKKCGKLSKTGKSSKSRKLSKSGKLKSKKLSKSQKLSKSGKSKSEKSSKSQKLSKLGKSKSEKTSKSQNLAKSGKKSSKSGNSTNFDATEDGPKFLTPCNDPQPIFCLSHIRADDPHRIFY